MSAGAPAADRVVEGEAGAGRFDLAVAALAGISRAHAQRLISDGRALVGGRSARASDRLKGGERIRVELSAPPDDTLLPESIPLHIAYEDEAILIVDKPAGLVVHPSAGHAAGTLVNALLGRAQSRGEPLGSVAGVGRPGIVHRLDKDTSGLLVVAKTDVAQASLMRQFGERTIEKEYLALVRGEAPSPHGRVEAPVGRDPRDRQRMAVVGGGRAAVTEYRVIGTGGGYTLLRLRPLTGRTHQIRAHLAYLGLPIAGDMRYGGGLGPGGLSRQFLHAAGLTLDRPLDGARLRAWSELPPDLGGALAVAGIDDAALPRGVAADLIDAHG
ncbi:MAG TPA: RluA family pseudouridine synthase [Candidatus Limnocylindria bacterium]|jgi:23S rRNA pseudouridine1911/1915/1917 synthase|nr:RluA family pseudouridine synthase [Candidatus Limnocylindria bacterium]